MKRRGLLSIKPVGKRSDLRSSVRRTAPTSLPSGAQHFVSLRGVSAAHDAAISCIRWFSAGVICKCLDPRSGAQRPSGPRSGAKLPSSLPSPVRKQSFPRSAKRRSFFFLFHPGCLTSISPIFVLSGAGHAVGIKAALENKPVIKGSFEGSVLMSPVDTVAEGKFR